jgi:hypothetical protein
MILQKPLCLPTVVKQAFWPNPGPDALTEESEPCDCDAWFAC